MTEYLVKDVTSNTSGITRELEERPVGAEQPAGRVDWALCHQEGACTDGVQVERAPDLEADEPPEHRRVEILLQLPEQGRQQQGVPAFGDGVPALQLAV
ncbi:hypothetical protein PMKS-002661 [Pichia membranifaciens]|uniref:Uncharacterized protein n=1 Tax=Pichia membranifaciens TaxID=4926 RepID=A0A1Q2YI07_9ASCO|nr:hypothetical protein PMKS-002661 [Pichia membranifaciens]